MYLRYFNNTFELLKGPREQADLSSPEAQLFEDSRALIFAGIIDTKEADKSKPWLWEIIINIREIETEVEFKLECKLVETRVLGLILMKAYPQ